MCRIVGLWNLNGQPVTLDALQCFTDSLAHRGPDGNGFYIDPGANLGLGHRRLAIIDTSDGGRQPMSFGEERYWIVFNGEIYNFLELKVELEKHGYQFQTDSDTEIILAAYHCWGEDCQFRFNGMSAFAIWDRQERELFISRDRFGVKPLVYYFDQNHFAFASEMKAFLALDWFQPDFDPSMMAAALSNERLIDGHGADEVLGGYPWHVTAALKDALFRLSPRHTRDLVSVMKNLELFPDDYFYIKSAQVLLTKILNGRKPSWLLQRPADFRSLAYEEDMSRIRGRDRLFKAMYMDFHFTQLPTNLRDFDRLSMAHGVEVRSPFMDWRLICFLFSLPSTAKIDSGFTKRTLQDALKGTLPESIRVRTRKLGFPNLEAWRSPRGQEFTRDIVHSAEFQKSNIWDGRKVSKDLALAIHNRNNEQLHRAWIYAQAMSLMNLFKEKSSTYQTHWLSI